MKAKVLDSYSLIAYLERDKGYNKVIEHFQKAVDTGRNLLFSTVNWGEVYYIVLREYGKHRADEVEKIIHALPIEIIDVDLEIAQEAGRFKATKKLSYADCFVAALAKLHKAELITGDKEFRTVEKEIKISWIV